MRLEIAAALVFTLCIESSSGGELLDLDGPNVSADGYDDYSTLRVDSVTPRVEDAIVRCNHSGCTAIGGPAYHQFERVWAKAEYLMWWSKGNLLPPLVTTSPPGTPRDEAGVLGLPTTTILLGDERVEDGLRNGGRVTAGFWFGNCQQTGLEASWFSLDDDDNFRYSAASQGTPILARPFFNVGLGAQDSQLVAFPDVVEGQIDVATDSEILSGGVVFRRRYRGGSRAKMDFLLGYRYMRFNEDLRITENLISTDPGGLIAQGTTFDVFDSFDTENDFHGADLGIALKMWRCPWVVDTTAKLAVGGVRQQLDINGGTTVTVPDLPPVTNRGGLLTSTTNIGSHDDTAVAIIPEFDINLHYYFTPDFSLACGYTVMVLTNVLRTGDQVDLAADATALPSAANASGTGFGRPEARLNDTAVWLQGLNFGIEIRR